MSSTKLQPIVAISSGSLVRQAIGGRLRHRVASHDLGIELVTATQPLLDVADFFYRYGAERAAVDAARRAVVVRGAHLADVAAPSRP